MPIYYVVYNFFWRKDTVIQQDCRLTVEISCLKSGNKLSNLNHFCKTATFKFVT